MSYNRESIFTIWNTVLPSSGTTACTTSCHLGGNNVLRLDDVDSTHDTSFHSIVDVRSGANLPNPIIIGNGSGSLLHFCPTDAQGGQCTTHNTSTVHGGGLRFNDGSLEDRAIVRWITDGALH